MIFFPLIIGTFLRVFKIWSNYYFTGESGRELLYVWQLTNSNKFPLIGLTTSHEWLNYGPIYYWILAPIVKIFGWSPYILFWLALAVSMIGILITYFVFKKIIDRKFALILSFFISLSPLWIWATRLSKLHVFFFVLIPTIIFCLYKIWNNEKKWMLWLGIAFGALFSFHFSHLPLFAVIILAFVIKHKKLNIKDYLSFLAGMIIPNITVLIYDAKSGFSMTKNLIMWIPYRVLGFVGFYPKNNMDSSNLLDTLRVFNEFFGRNLFTDSRFWIVGTFIFFCLFVWFFIEKRKSFNKDFLTFYIISSTAVQCISLLVHTSPPVHYFFPIFLNFGILFTYFAHKLWQKKTTKIFTAIIYMLMIPMVIFYLNNEHMYDRDYVPISEQEQVVDEVVKEAAGKPFNLERVGPYDYFPENYSQNYQFLILSRGGTLDANANLKFIIYDEVGVHDTGKVYMQKYEATGDNNIK